MFKRVRQWVGRSSTATVAVIALVPLVAIAVMLAVYLPHDSAHINELIVIWYVVSYAMLVTMTGLFLLVVHSAETTHERMVSAVKKQLEEQSKTLDERLAPDIRVLRNMEDVRTEAARVLEQVAHASEDERLVTYYGAANLSPSKADVEKAEDDSGVKINTPAMRFKMAFDTVLSAASGVEVTRYIRLFGEHEFGGRSEGFQKDHLAWFRGQLAMLKSSTCYRLAVAARAPEWGGTTSILVGADTLLLIVGGGSSAILIRGFDVAKGVTDHAKKFMDSAAEINRPRFFSKNTTAELESLLEKHYGKFGWN